MNVTAWQGGGLVVEPLEPVAGKPGVYTTAEPVPVGGNWKTMVRYSSGNTLNSMPIYLPDDSGDPGRGSSGDRRASNANSSPTTRCFSASRRAASPAGSPSFAYLVVAASLWRCS